MLLGSGTGLCYIDRVKFRDTQKNFKNFGSPRTAGYTLYYTQSIKHYPIPLPSGIKFYKKS